MAVPGYQSFMLPLLSVAGDGAEHGIAEAMDVVAKEMRISEADQEAVFPSNPQQTIYYKRFCWAITYLRKAGLIASPTRGRFVITERGREALAKKPPKIDAAFLKQYEEFRSFAAKTAKAPATSTTKDAPPSEQESAPEERLDAAYQELRDALADDLQSRVREGSARFFEHLVIRLLVAMGYGGGQVDRAEVTGKSGDEGIDGVIREDRLGLDMVYVQAKKWDNAVGPGEIDKFVGSLMRKKATKGVFITSGTFTEGAQRAAKEAAVKVRLIDGDELAELMIDFNVGVAPADTYIVKKVDTDFFEGVG